MKKFLSLTLALVLSLSVFLCGNAQAEEAEELTLCEALDYVYKNADVEMEVELDRENGILRLRVPGCKVYKLYSHKDGYTYLLDREDVEDVASQIWIDWYCEPIELEAANRLVADLLGEDGWIIKSSMEMLEDGALFRLELWGGVSKGWIEYKSLGDLTRNDVNEVYFDAIEAFGW